MSTEIHLQIEWKAFKNEQFGRNFTYKTKLIYGRSEVILLTVLSDILEGKLVVDEEDLHRRIVKQVAGVAKRLYPKLSATSLNIYIRVWNTFLNSLYKDEQIRKPAKIQPLQEQKKQRRVLTDEQLQKLISAKIGMSAGLNLYRIHAMALTALGTGARLNEVLMLYPEDILFNQSLINIYSGKGRKQRVVPTSPTLAKTLHRFMQKREVPPKNPIFGSKINRTPQAKLKNPNIKNPYARMSSSNVVRDLGLLCKHLDIPRFKFHELRHTFATRYLKNGGNPAKLRQILGHSSIVTTMIYEHMDHQAISEKFSEYTPF